MIVWNEIRTLLICDKNLVVFGLKRTLSKRTLYLCMMLIEKIPTYAMNAKSCVFFSILDAFSFFVSTHGSICRNRKGRSTGKAWKWWVCSAAAQDNPKKPDFQKMLILTCFSPWATSDRIIRSRFVHNH